MLNVQWAITTAVFESTQKNADSWSRQNFDSSQAEQNSKGPRRKKRSSFSKLKIIAKKRSLTSKNVSIRAQPKQRYSWALHSKKNLGRPFHIKTFHKKTRSIKKYVCFRLAQHMQSAVLGAFVLWWPYSFEMCLVSTKRCFLYPDVSCKQSLRLWPVRNHWSKKAPFLLSSGTIRVLMIVTSLGKLTTLTAFH
jgi:hypothetical protein